MKDSAFTSSEIQGSQHPNTPMQQVHQDGYTDFEIADKGKQTGGRGIALCNCKVAQPPCNSLSMKWDATNQYPAGVPGPNCGAISLYLLLQNDDRTMAGLGWARTPCWQSRWTSLAQLRLQNSLRTEKCLLRACLMWTPGGLCLQFLQNIFRLSGCLI